MTEACREGGELYRASRKEKAAPKNPERPGVLGPFRAGEVVELLVQRNGFLPGDRGLCRNGKVGPH